MSFLGLFLILWFRRMDGGKVIVLKCTFPKRFLAQITTPVCIVTYSLEWSLIKEFNPLKGLGMEPQTLLRRGSFSRSPLLLSLDGLFRYFFLQSWKFRCNIYSKFSQDILSSLCGICCAEKPHPVACGICRVPFQPEGIPRGTHVDLMGLNDPPPPLSPKKVSEKVLCVLSSWPCW